MSFHGALASAAVFVLAVAATLYVVYELLALARDRFERGRRAAEDPTLDADEDDERY